MNKQTMQVMDTTDERYHIKYGADNWKDKAVSILKTEGVLVIDHVFEYEECDNAMEDIVDNFKELSSPLKEMKWNNGTQKWSGVGRSWIRHNLPSQTRNGLFQRLMANQDIYWKFKTDKRTHEVFETLYSGLRGKEVKEFVTSMDGLNFKPPNDCHDIGEDWAHIDQTFHGKFECIQGQVVLSDTTAAFRASPRSHNLHSDIINKYDIEGKFGNFYRFDAEQIAHLKDKVILEQGGEWQKKFFSRRGSMVFWLSNTIHSASLQIKDYDYSHLVDTNPKWLGWRGIFYICHRPKAEIDGEHRARLIKTFDTNRTTNHWGVKVFPDIPRNPPISKLHEDVRHYMKKPQDVYKLDGWQPAKSDEIKSLLGEL
jgi:hypothetical protein